MSQPIQAERQVVLDTETTGMNNIGPVYEGHRIIEIGAVELKNRRPTGNVFHVYIKPDRLVDPDAIRVHGITDEMLADKPEFSEIAQEFIEFISGAELIIHNAPFDVSFMDYEFSKLDAFKEVKTANISTITDTLVMARKLFPGKKNNLDALCDRYFIDNSKRVLHGALLNAEILGDVYLAMTGGQVNLFDQSSDQKSANQLHQQRAQRDLEALPPLRCIQPNEEEIAQHEKYLELLNKKSGGNCRWDKNTDETLKH